MKSILVTIEVDGVRRATVSESPADPVDAPGEAWKDYRIFDEKGDYLSQHSCDTQSIEKKVCELIKHYRRDD